MRVLITATLAAALFATNLLAAEVGAPLPPGKAAGVKKAQSDNDMAVLVVAGGAAAIGLIALAVGGNGNSTARTAVGGSTQ